LEVENDFAGSGVVVDRNLRATASNTLRSADTPKDTVETGENIRRIAQDKCTLTDFSNPISILSQKKEIVTFSIAQVWKGCSSDDAELGWIATDYIGLAGHLCAKLNALDCGAGATYTAKCTDGATVIDIFAYDDDSIFGQLDGSGIAVPSACDPTGDPKKMCHFRYIVSCESTESASSASF
jgi:hypothetical protein